MLIIYTYVSEMVTDRYEVIDSFIHGLDNFINFPPYGLLHKEIKECRTKVENDDQLDKACSVMAAVSIQRLLNYEPALNKTAVVVDLQSNATQPPVPCEKISFEGMPAFIKDDCGAACNGGSNTTSKICKVIYMGLIAPTPEEG